MKPHYTNTDNPVDFPKVERKMNKLIDELAEQCYVKTGSVHTDHFAYWKFAELIVRECLVQVRDEVQYEYDWKLADAVTKRVMEHFGVE